MAKGCDCSTVLSGKILSSNADDACSDQFLDFGTDTRVLHVFIQSGRIAFGLLQDRLHDRVG